MHSEAGAKERVQLQAPPASGLTALPVPLKVQKPEKSLGSKTESKSFLQTKQLAFLVPALCRLHTWPSTHITAFNPHNSLVYRRENQGSETPRSLTQSHSTGLPAFWADILQLEWGSIRTAGRSQALAVIQPPSICLSICPAVHSFTQKKNHSLI